MANIKESEGIISIDTLHKTIENTQQNEPQNEQQMLSIWIQTVSNLEKVIPPQNFANWIHPIHYNTTFNDTLILTVPSKFFEDWVEDNYMKLIRDAVSTTAMRSLNVELRVREETKLAHFFI